MKVNKLKLVMKKKRLTSKTWHGFTPHQDVEFNELYRLTLWAT